MSDSAQVIYEKGKLYDLALVDVQPDPEQPRKYFDEQALAELKTSIEKHGVLQPVLVRQGADGGLLLVSVNGAARRPDWPVARRFRLFLRMANRRRFPSWRTCCGRT